MVFDLGVQGFGILLICSLVFGVIAQVTLGGGTTHGCGSSGPSPGSWAVSG